MWYSVVDPNSPGYKNKVVASFATKDEAQSFADALEDSLQVVFRFHSISTPTKPSIGEVINPQDLPEDQRASLTSPPTPVTH